MVTNDRVIAHFVVVPPLLAKGFDGSFIGIVLKLKIFRFLFDSAHLFVGDF